MWLIHIYEPKQSSDFLDDENHEYEMRGQRLQKCCSEGR
jgi:hypothetical protein